MLTEIVIGIRHLIDDYTEPYTYSDARLEELIILTALQIKTEVTFQQDYTVDLDAMTLSPNPTASATRDENFIVLVALKAACILARSEAKKAAGQAISWKQKDSAVDRRGVGDAKLKIAK